MALTKRERKARKKPGGSNVGKYERSRSLPSVDPLEDHLLAVTLSTHWLGESLL